MNPRRWLKVFSIALPIFSGSLAAADAALVGCETSEHHGSLLNSFKTTCSWNGLHSNPTQGPLEGRHWLGSIRTEPLATPSVRLRVQHDFIAPPTGHTNDGRRGSIFDMLLPRPAAGSFSVLAQVQDHPGTAALKHKDVARLSLSRLGAPLTTAVEANGIHSNATGGWSFKKKLRGRLTVAQSFPGGRPNEVIFPTTK